MNENTNTELRKLVSGWVQQQNTTAKELGISPAGLNKMLKGVSPLPFSRFLQLGYYLRPPQNEVDRAFGLYLQELNLPEDGLRLTRKSGMTETAALDDRRARIHAMIDQLSDEQLAGLEPMLAMLAGNPKTE